MEINELQKVIVGFFCEKFPAEPGAIIPQYTQITEEEVFPNKLAKELAKLIGLEYGLIESGDSIRARLDEMVKSTVMVEELTVPLDFLPPITAENPTFGASLIGAEGTDKAPPKVPKAIIPPARKVKLMPDCRSFNLERHCDAGKKTVNCCGPDCRQYNSKPKPVAALLIAQLTKK